MIKQPSPETEQALAKLAKAAGGEGSYHLAPIYVCDHCHSQDREAFPYGVYDRKGRFWNDLCNDCYDELGCNYPDRDYSGLYNLLGDNFNIEAVCPDYLPESQCVFTWYRDDRGVAIVSGYDPYQDITTDWLCNCGHYEEGGCCCAFCGNEPPWGCIGCGRHDDDEYDMDMDFGEFDPYEGDYEDEPSPDWD